MFLINRNFCSKTLTRKFHGWSSNHGNNHTKHNHASLTLLNNFHGNKTMFYEKSLKNTNHKTLASKDLNHEKGRKRCVTSRGDDSLQVSLIQSNQKSHSLVMKWEICDGWIKGGKLRQWERREILLCDFFPNLIKWHKSLLRLGLGALPPLDQTRSPRQLA